MRVQKVETTSLKRIPNTISGWKRATTPIALLLAAVTLGGCVTNDGGQYGQKQGWGTLLGAGAGALAGSQIGQGRGQLAAVAIGALAGGLIGNEIGSSLDRSDRLHHAKAQKTALQSEDWQTVKWSNPDTGHEGSITPTRTMRRGNHGPICREYRTTVTIGGRIEEGYGRACREPDGSWRIVS